MTSTTTTIACFRLGYKKKGFNFSKRSTMTFTKWVPKFMTNKPLYPHVRGLIWQSTMRYNEPVKNTTPLPMKMNFTPFSRNVIGLVIPRCPRTCLIARPKLPVRIFVRHLLRTTNRLVGEPLAQNISRSRSVLVTDKFGNTRFVSGTLKTVHAAPAAVTNHQQSCGMTSVVGQFNKGSGHYETVCSPHNKVPHRSIIDSELLVPGSTASQAANNLTTKANAYEKDTRITEQTEAIGTTTVNGKTVPRFLTWKENEPRITAEDVTPVNFKVERSTTDDEDKEFQDSKEGKKKPMYRSSDANVKPRFTSGKTEKKKPLPSDKPEQTKGNNEKEDKNKNDDS